MPVLLRVRSRGVLTGSDGDGLSGLWKLAGGAGVRRFWVLAGAMTEGGG